MEFYEAYGDYNTYMALSEKLLSELAKKVHGDYKFTYQGKTLDFTPPFNRVYWVQELKEKYGLDILNLTDEKAVELARKENLDVAIMNAYHVADALFDKYIKSGLLQPSFVLDYPAYMCPLTKDKRGNPALSERFEFFVANLELGNCYSELTDPIEQRAKFEHQEAEHAKGDSEAPPSDESFLEAMEFGMPPTAGMGLAVDRLSMIMSDNTSIKEVLAFPSMRPSSINIRK